MICKDSVLKWFKGLSSHNRIDLMCSLLNKCLPFELRFMGTCLEDLGRQDFTQMKDFEVKANNLSELNEFQVQCIISDTRTRQKLALYVCLLHSLNSTCSTLIYKSLYGIDINEVVSMAKTDSKILEELLTIYTVAVNHPAFSFEQRSNLGSILLRLSQEENRIDAEKLAETVNSDYSQAQLVSQCPESHRPIINSEIPPPTVPPGINYPPGLGTTGSFIPFPVYPSFPTQQMPHQSIVWQLVNYQPVAESLASADLSQFTASPLMSRHSSPAQSAQHSRAASPTRKNFYSRNERIDLHQKQRPPYSENNFPVPPPASGKNSFPEVNNDAAVTIDNEQVRSLSERMNELSTEEMLRGAVVSLNGMTAPTRGNVQLKPPPPPLHPSFDPEILPPGSGSFARPLELNTVPLCPPGVAVPRIPAPSVQRYNQQCLYKQNNYGLEEVRPCSSGSGSDASSTSHSPPVTPANHNVNWEKGFEPDEAIIQPKPRVGMGRGRGRYGAQSGQTLPRERAPHEQSVRRDGPRSAPPTPHEEKRYLGPPSCGEIAAPLSVTKPMPGHDIITGGVTYTAAFVPGPFTTAPPHYPPYAPAFVRPPYSYPNGDLMYTYQPQPPAPFMPSPLVTYSSSVPPPKIACYNCSSQTHHPNDCKEPTMEEYSSKGQYRIDYGKTNDLVNSEK